MKTFPLFFAALFTLFLLPGAAAADPVTAFFVTVGFQAATAAAITAALIQVGVGLAVTALAVALRGRPKAPGIRTQSTTAGDTTPQSFILGRYATAGNLVAPEMSHGSDNGYLVNVIDVGDIPITGFESAIVNGRNTTFGNPVNSFGQLEPTNQSAYGDGRLRTIFFDGNQTTASSYLLSRYGSRSVRPWVSDMIGRGVPYFVFSFKFRTKTWNGKPTVKLVVRGIALYDPRKDTTVGGSGTHRFDTRSTHEYTENPVVMIYNLLRGIQLPDGEDYGGGSDFEDLPLATWVAAMNECDVTVDGKPQYAAGYEVKIGTPDVGGDEPLDVIDELLKSCSGDIADVGGTVYIRVGAPGLPVKFITDDDILRSSEQDLDSFPALNQGFNGVHASYPSPDDLWEPKDAPPRYDLDAEAEDGQRLIADMKLHTVTDGSQVQRLMRAWLLDARRHRNHNITLPPEAITINPLETIGWTSDRNGYVSKVFEVGQVGIAARTLSTTLSLRERDPDDYDWEPGFEIDVTAPSVETVIITPQAVPDFAVQGVTLTDGNSQDRRPALKLTWNPDVADARGLIYEVRVQGQPVLSADGTVASFETGQTIVSAGILPNTIYEVRAQLLVNRETEWTAWLVTTSPDVKLTLDELAQGIIDFVNESGAIASVDSLPLEAEIDTFLFLRSDKRLYRYTVTDDAPGWVPVVTAETISGQLVAGQIAANSVGAEQLTANSVTSEKIDVVELSAISANIGVFSSSPEGERVVISDDRIQVFDSGNVLRVVIGNLS